MASSSTTRWVSTAPYVTISASIDTTKSTGDKAVINWSLTYTSDSAADTSVAKSYTVTLNGDVKGTLKTGTYDIDGKTGTHTIASGTYSINKTHSSQSLVFGVTFEFNLTWSGKYKGTTSATVTLSVPRKTSYTVKYNMNGIAEDSVPAAQTKWYGETLTLSNRSIVLTDRYTLIGWSTSPTGSKEYSIGGAYTKNASVTLYAVWQPAEFTVTYNANGGSGAPASQTKIYNTPLTLSGVTPTRDKYSFRGWGTTTTATTASYQPGGTYTGNAKITLYAIWSLDYAKPRMSNVSVYRSDSDYNPKDDAEGATVKFDWATDRENPTLKIELINSGEVTHHHTTTGSGTSGTFKIYMSGGSGAPISADKTYTVRITVADSDGSHSVSRTLAGVKYVVDFLAGGKGVSFGKPAEHEGYADFGYEILLDNNLRIAGANLDGDPVEAFQPQNSNGNTVIGWGNYNASNDLTSEERLAKTNGHTNVYGHDVHIGVASIPNPGTYRPYRRRGDSLTFTLRTAGYVTNSGKDVTFIVPFAIPILGGATATATSGNGFVLRQNGAYTHGSASSTYIHPDSYSASVSMFCGVYVTAHFSETAAAINVVNNAPIGIYWNGTITFS